LDAKISAKKNSHSNSKKLQIYLVERSKRHSDLDFLLKTCGSELNISQEAESDTDLDEGDSDGLGDLTLADDVKNNTFSNEFVNEVLDVSVQTFGEVRKLVIIQIPKENSLFSRPAIRQYFIGDVLHRQRHKMHVEWVELFFDLIYVGAFSKASHFIGDYGYGYKGFGKFYLTFIPILYRWRAYTILKNTFHDNSMVRKLFDVIVIGIVVLMTVSIEHSFDHDVLTNTSDLFLGFHLASSVLVEFYQLLATFIADKRFLKWVYYKSMASLFSYLPYFILLVGFPLDGSTGREDIRVILWIIGTITEAITIPIFLAISSLTLKHQHRLAINIEHLAERYGLLMVIVLGETIFAFLSSYPANYPLKVLRDVVFGMASSVCLFYLYFRAEVSSHYKHALRRHWISGSLWSCNI
jgi:low temperature requirement protein LtrA